MTQAPDRDDERDTYLREALRHAPDAALGPPAALSDAILRQARSAPMAAPAARAASAELQRHGSPRRVLDDLWSWLARPPVAAGFASVIAATLVGMMWWDRPMDEALPPRPALPAAAPPGRAAAVDTPSEAAAPIAPTAPSVATAPKRDTPSASKPVVAGAQASTEAPARDARDRAGVSKAPPPVREPANLAKDTEAALRRATPQPFPGSSESASEESMRQRQQAAAPSARSEPAPPTSPPGVVTTAPLAELKAAAPSAKKERATAAPTMAGRAFDQAPSNSTGSAQTDSAQAAERPAPGLANRFAAQPGPSPLVALRATLAEQPRRWTWTREDGSAQPMNATVQAWLARLDDATISSVLQGNAKPGDPEEARGSLQAARRDAEDTDVSAPLQVLRLLRDGRLHTTLRLRNQSVQVDTIGTPDPHWQTPLAPSAGAALKASMPEAPR
jgi:hypothetical protein